MTTIDDEIKALERRHRAAVSRGEHNAEVTHEEVLRLLARLREAEAERDRWRVWATGMGPQVDGLLTTARGLRTARGETLSCLVGMVGTTAATMRRMLDAALRGGS